MEPEWIVLVVSSVGVLISGFMWWDAYRDRRAVRDVAKEDNGLNLFTRQRLVTETARVVILLAFTFIAIAVIIGSEKLEAIAVWVLVGIPILIVGASIHSWWRRVQLDKELESSGYLRHSNN